jgi:hypothetical protein
VPSLSGYAGRVRVLGGHAPRARRVAAEAVPDLAARAVQQDTLILRAHAQALAHLARRVTLDGAQAQNLTLPLGELGEGLGQRVLQLLQGDPFVRLGTARIDERMDRLSPHVAVQRSQHGQGHRPRRPPPHRTRAIGEDAQQPGAEQSPSLEARDPSQRRHPGLLDQVVRIVRRRDVVHRDPTHQRTQATYGLGERGFVPLEESAAEHRLDPSRRRRKTHVRQVVRGRLRHPRLGPVHDRFSHNETFIEQRRSPPEAASFAYPSVPVLTGARSRGRSRLH